VNKTGSDGTWDSNSNTRYPADARKGCLGAVNVLPYPYPSCPPTQEGNRSLLLARSQELFGERFVVESPFDVISQPRVPELSFYRGVDRKRVFVRQVAPPLASPRSGGLSIYAPMSGAKAGGFWNEADSLRFFWFSPTSGSVSFFFVAVSFNRCLEGGYIERSAFAESSRALIASAFVSGCIVRRQMGTGV